MKSKEDIITEICANSNGSWVDIAWEVWDEAIKYKEAQSSNILTPQSKIDKELAEKIWDAAVIYEYSSVEFVNPYPDKETFINSLNLK